MSKLVRGQMDVDEEQEQDQEIDETPTSLRTYSVKIEGATPLIMHADDLTQQARLEAWRSDPKNKSSSVAGDDRSPPWTWQTYLYNDGDHVIMPEANLRACLMIAGQKCPKKGRGSYKTEAVSGILFDSPQLPFLVDGRQLRMRDVVAINSMKFDDQIVGAQKLGFDLICKRATVGQTKHVRVRPIFRRWSTSTKITVVSDVLTREVIERIFEVAGTLVGLCDWRPSEKKSPGPYGQFKATVI